MLIPDITFAIGFIVIKSSLSYVSPSYISSSSAISIISTLNKSFDNSSSNILLPFNLNLTSQSFCLFNIDISLSFTSDTIDISVDE